MKPFLKIAALLIATLLTTGRAGAQIPVDCPAPVNITTQPQHRTLASGATLTVTVGATGTPALSYQWLRGGVTISGATNQTYTKPGVTPADSGTYQVVVSNCAGPQTSAPAYVGVASPSYTLIGLTNHFWKYDQSAADLGTAWREAAYNDALWPSRRGVFARENNAVITPLTNTELSLTNALGQPVETFYFRTHFTLTNEPGSFCLVASNLIDDGAVVYLNGAEVCRINMPAGNITADAVREEGQTVALTVGVSGIGARYQWYKNGSTIPGATQSSFTIASTTTNDTGIYYAVATNAINRVNSALASLTVFPDSNGPTLVDADGTLGPNKVFVTFSEPILAANAPNLANYKITNTLGGILAISSAVFTNGTNVLLTTTPGRAPTANYILIVNGIHDASPHSNLITANSMIPIAQFTTLIAFTANWRHFYDLFGPPYAPLGAVGAWKLLNYNDDDPDGWYGGAGAFVFDGTGNLEIGVPVQTALAFPVPSYYFRGKFNYPGTQVGSKLYLRHLVDAGAVFYLNGQEVARTNLPAGTITDSTLANIEPGSPPISNPIELPIGGLLSGSNVLTAELHPSSLDTLTDEDVVFAAELVARVPSLPVGPILITSQPQSRVVTEGSSVTFSVTVVGAARVQWQVNGTHFPGATNAVFTIPQTPFAWNNSLVRVLCTGTNGTVTSSSATLTVLHDTTPPVLLSARAVEDGTFILTFSEALSAGYATNLANYSITNATGASIAVTGATLINGTNVVLTCAPFVNGNPIIVVSNLRDASTDANVLAPNPSGWWPGFDVFIPIDAAWRYHQSGADLGTAWKDVGYDDSVAGWSNGLALLYVESAALPAPKNTLLSLTGTNGLDTITFYFRHAFLSPMTISNIVFTLRHLVDDGAVVYWNGVEVYRFNMPAGGPLYSTRASAGVGDALFLGPYHFTNNLAGGTNVLAVEVHQVGPSGDVVFGAEVSFSVPGGAVAFTPPHLELIHFSSLLVLDWSEPSCTLEGANAVTGPWTTVSLNAPFLTSKTNSAAFYRLRR